MNIELDVANIAQARRSTLKKVHKRNQVIKVIPYFNIELDAANIALALRYAVNITLALTSIFTIKLLI